MKVVSKIAFTCLIFIAAFAGGIENSIVPIMENFECVENLPAAKFSKNQFHEISNALERKQEKIRLVTYNMLFNLHEDRLDEENRWVNRLPRIVNLIEEIEPDIISTQELYPAQVQDIVSLLESDFSFFSGQRDEDGESYGIFYRTNRFELISSQMNYPLSSLKLKDMKTGKVICVFNTHMSFSNIEKRESSAHQIVDAIDRVAKDTPVILTGDLNTFPGRLDLKDLPFYDGDYIHRILSKGALKNSSELALLGHFGPISTFTNKEDNVKPFQGTGTPGIILDYIYVSNKITVLTHAVEPSTVDGHFPSDHMPVLIDFLID